MITRNVDLSVEAVIGLVAFVVADILGSGALPTPVAMLVGIGLGLVLGMINGFIVAVLRVPSIVATLGTLSIYRGIDFLLAGGKQVTLTSLPAGYTEIARSTFAGIPVFVLVAVAIVVAFGILLRVTRFGRSVYAVGSNPEAAGDPGHPARARSRSSCSPLCGLLGGVAGVMWGILFGTINATAASGVTLQVIAAVVVGGVNIFGGSGTVFGAALGALFLGFVVQRADPASPLAVLAAGDLRHRHPRRGRARCRPAAPVPANGCRTATAMNGGRRGVIASLARWETLLAIVLIVLIGIGASLSPVFLTPRNFANLIAAVIEVAIMSLPMALIIISGEIDLSVESMVGLSARGPRNPVCRGRPDRARHPASCSWSVRSAACSTACSSPGWASPRWWSRSGTLALYRGLALVVLGSRGVSAFPDWFTTFGFGTMPGIPDPVAVHPVPGPGRRARRTAPPDLGRAPDLCHRQELVGRLATPASRSPASSWPCSSCPGPSPPLPGSS